MKSFLIDFLSFDDENERKVFFSANDENNSAAKNVLLNLQGGGWGVKGIIKLV